MGTKGPSWETSFHFLVFPSGFIYFCCAPPCKSGHVPTFCNAATKVSFLQSFAFPRIQGTHGTAQPRVGMSWALKPKLLKENRKTVGSGVEMGQRGSKLLKDQGKDAFLRQGWGQVSPAKLMQGRPPLGPLNCLGEGLQQRVAGRLQAAKPRSLCLKTGGHISWEMCEQTKGH